MLGWEKREEKEGRRKGSREERREEGSGGRESEIICISTAVQLWPGGGRGRKSRKSMDAQKPGDGFYLGFKIDFNQLTRRFSLLCGPNLNSQKALL